MRWTVIPGSYLLRAVIFLDLEIARLDSSTSFDLVHVTKLQIGSANETHGAAKAVRPQKVPLLHITAQQSRASLLLCGSVLESKAHNHSARYGVPP